MTTELKSALMALVDKELGEAKDRHYRFEALCRNFTKNKPEALGSPWGQSGKTPLEHLQEATAERDRWVRIKQELEQVQPPPGMVYVILEHEPGNSDYPLVVPAVALTQDRAEQWVNHAQAGAAKSSDDLWWEIEPAALLKEDQG